MRDSPLQEEESVQPRLEGFPSTHASCYSVAMQTLVLRGEARQVVSRLRGPTRPVRGRPIPKRIRKHRRKDRWG